MKNSFLKISALIAIFGIVVVVYAKTHKAFNPINYQMSLNGLSEIESNDIISKFNDDNTTIEKKTAIWFSKPWLDTITKIISSEAGADGLRIYFGKDVNNVITTVPISTQNGSKDYFDHNNSRYSKIFDNLKSNPKNYIVEDHNGNDPGATLFRDKFDSTTYKMCSLTAINNVTFRECWNYIKKIQNSTNPATGINTNSLWYKVDFIKNLDALLNKYPITEKIDGIRLYFGKKTDKTFRNIFIIMPTKQNGKESHLDDYSCYDLKPFHKVEELLGGTDNGEQCPNNCNGVTLPKP